MIAKLSDATVVTAIVAAFFLLLALIASARTIFRSHPPSARRFRVGVFVERDQISDEEEDEADG